MARATKATRTRKSIAAGAGMHADLSRAFASLDSAGGREEVMIHVYWSGLGDERDVREGGRGHLMQRDKVTASLGLDRVPVPGFSASEMESIAYAAKMAALKCLRARRGRR